MKKNILCISFLVSQMVCSQVGINTENLNPKAVLELKQNANNQAKGLMLTRLTDAEMNGMNLVSTDEGMVIYNKTQKKFFGWDGTSWQNLGYEVVNTPVDCTQIGAVRVNEFNYNNDGTDNEWIEIRIADPQPNPSCLNQFKVFSYKPTGDLKGTFNFGGASSSGNLGGYTYYVINTGSNSLQNDDSGFGFVAPDGTKELLGWGNAFTVVNTDANFGGQSSTSIGVAQTGNNMDAVARDVGGTWYIDSSPTKGGQND